jgi:hypothetical protein
VLRASVRVQSTGDATPASLGLEDDDTLDCMIMQTGGARGSGASKVFLACVIYLLYSDDDDK